MSAQSKFYVVLSLDFTLVFDSILVMLNSLFVIFGVIHLLFCLTRLDKLDYFETVKCCYEEIGTALQHHKACILMYPINYHFTDGASVYSTDFLWCVGRGTGGPVQLGNRGSLQVKRAPRCVMKSGTVSQI